MSPSCACMCRTTVTELSKIRELLRTLDANLAAQIEEKAEMKVFEAELKNINDEIDKFMHTCNRGLAIQKTKNKCEAPCTHALQGVQSLLRAQLYCIT